MFLCGFVVQFKRLPLRVACALRYCGGRFCSYCPVCRGSLASIHRSPWGYPCAIGSAYSTTRAIPLLFVLLYFHQSDYLGDLRPFPLFSGYD